MASARRCWLNKLRQAFRFNIVSIQSKRLPMMVQSNNWRIPRRTFLRGAGVMLGLPILEAMGRVLPAASAEAVAAGKVSRNVQAPVRLACLYFPNGVWEANWFPKDVCPEFQLPFALEPLGQHKQDLIVF